MTAIPMRILCAFVLFAFPCAFAESEESADVDLVLLQTHAERKPSKAIDVIGSQLDELQESITKEQQEHATAIESRKASYVQKLAAEELGNRKVIDSNLRLSEEIKQLRSTNAELRGRARSLLHGADNLKDVLHALDANLTIAKEFVDEALHGVKDKAPELAVLDELAQEEEASSAREARKHRLDEVESPSLKRAAMLEVREQDPSELLKALELHLEELLSEREGSMSSLEGKFDVKLKLLTEHNGQLLEEQSQLQDTKTSLLALQARLQTAVSHLESSNEHLTKRISALRRFAAGVGGAKAKGVALLQVSGEPAAAPEDEISLSHPAEGTVIHNLSSEISTLEHTVEKGQRENDAAIAEQKASYESKLKAQQQENREAAAENDRITSLTAGLDKDNAELQAQSKALELASRLLQADIRALQRNFTTAHEFASNMLDNLNNSTFAPELVVLGELREEREASEEKNAHEQRLGEIGTVVGAEAPAASLLQVAKPKGSTEPSGIVELLNGNLDAMQEEQSFREATLKSEFTEKINSGTARYERLMSERVALEEKYNASSELRSRLQVAVAHLTDVQTRLADGLRSLRGFAAHAGGDANSKVMLLQTHAEKAAPGHHAGSKAFGSVSSTLSAFEASLTEAREHHKAIVADKVSAHAKEIHELDSDIRAIMDQNANLTSEIQHLRGSDAQLRERAADFQKRNGAIVDDLHSLEEKLALANEYVEEALRIEPNAPELQILQDLEKEEHSDKARSEHEHRLAEIAGKAAMLEVRQGSADPKEILHSLADSLDGLVKEQEGSEAALTARFAAETDSRVAKRTALIAVHSELEASRASMLALHSRLQTAVEFLERTNTGLTTKRSSLRRYAENLGREGKNHALAFVQLDADAGPALHDGVDMDSVQLKEPSRHVAVNDVTSKISALEEAIKLQQEDQDKMLLKLKASYEQNLTNQQRESREIATENTKISKDISALMNETGNLQATAAAKEHSNRFLEAEVRALQANFSMADEFAKKALNSFGDAAEAPELDVLKELANEARNHADGEVHAKRLGEIKNAASLPALLQVPVALKKPSAETGKPQSLVRLLQGNLEAMSSEANSRESSLERSFFEKFQAGAKRRQELEADHASLEKRRSSLTTLRSRLQAAVEQLSGVEAELKEGIQSLRGFSAHVGGADAGLMLLQTRAQIARVTPSSRPKVFGGTADAQLASQLESFEMGVEGEQKSHAEAMGKQKAAYAQVLVTQQLENRAIADANVKLSVEINRTRKDNDKARKRALDLQEDGRQMIAQLNAMEANLTLAQDYIKESLRAGMDGDEPELQVLRDLDQEDQSRQAESAHQHKLDEIASAGKHAAMLEVADADVGATVDPKAILEALESHLDELEQTHAESEAKLKERFQEKLAEFTSKNVELVGEQSQLQETHSSLLALQARLQAAVEHIEQQNQKLSEQTTSLKSFAHELGAQ